uniref:Calponin-homology (CH) domain-containing protein n=1 Tax=Haptolina brevifila TaxID=156173 RepID=A0A7S2DMQ5_9EUKA
MDTEGAARAWVYAVLYPQAEPSEVNNDGRSFHEVLQSGVLLCKLLNRISPGMIHRIKETDKAWDCIENIGNYTKACEKLGVVPTFDTPDLYENKNMRVVAQNIYSLARMARSKRFAGPLLAAPVYTMPV